MIEIPTIQKVEKLGHPALCLMLIAGVLIACCTFNVNAQKLNDLSIQYQFPSNGAKSIPRGTTIIIRPGSILNPSSIDTSLISVTGSFSGKHSGAFILADDQKTLIFKPSTLFTYYERVHVKLKAGILTANGLPVDSLAFFFTIQAHPVAGQTTKGGMTATPIRSSPMETLLDTSDPLGGSAIQSPNSLGLNITNVYSANRNTKIQLTLSKAIICDVKVFDSFGREVITLASGEIAEGCHMFNLDMLPSGIYHCVISCEGTTFVRQIAISR